MTNKTALQIATELKEGQLKLGSYIDETLDNIKKDEHNAFFSVAELAELSLKNTSPLSGVAIGIADNILAGGELGTAGSQMLYNFIPPYTATIIDKLDNAGLIRVGRTNIPEFGIGTAGSNAVFGPALHPLAENKVSEGTATAVACGLVPLGLSVDSNGNPRKFAAMAGVTCLKPTYGAVSRFGIVPYLESSEVVAITANNISDAASLFNIIAGNDKNDGTTYPHPQYELCLENKGIQGMKVALPKQLFGDEVNPEVKATIAAFIQKITELGAKVSEVDIPYAKYANIALLSMAAAEGANNFSRYDGIKYGYQSEQNSSLDDIYFNSRSEGLNIDAKRTAILGAQVLSHGCYKSYYLKALQIRRLIHEQVKELFKEYEIILTPAAAGFAYDLKDSANYYQEEFADRLFTAIPTITGIPAAVLPAGVSNAGLPIGVQIMADTLQEEKLIQLALACGL